jgi:hypothetical protein
MSKKKPRVFVFETKQKSRDGRSYLLAIPEAQIMSLKSIVGGQRVYLEVNGVEVQGSFDGVVGALGERVNAREL